MHCVEVGDPVNVPKYSRDYRWIPGTIFQETGPLSARIELEDGTVVQRHHNQVVSNPVDSPFQQDSVIPEMNHLEATHGERELSNTTEVLDSRATPKSCTTIPSEC